MANEAVPVNLLGNLGDPIQFTVVNAQAFEKGTLMIMSDPRTVSGANLNYAISSAPVFAGILNSEKVASDGSTTVGVWTRGVFDLKCATACSFGDTLVISGANEVRIASAVETASGATVKVGKALESASAGEVIQVAVGVY